MNIIKIDLRGLGTPVIAGLKQWAVENQDQLPCCLLHEIEKETVLDRKLLSDRQNNYVSAISAPNHPRFFAYKDPQTGEVSFPFWGDCGKGIRRQDLDPVYLAIPLFAVIRAPNKPFIPIALSQEHYPPWYK